LKRGLLTEVVMKITVRSVMHIADALGGRTIEVEVDNGADITKLVEYLSKEYGTAFSKHIFLEDGSIKFGGFSILQNGCSIFANDGFSSALNEGDDVLILSAISGG